MLADLLQKVLDACRRDHAARRTEKRRGVDVREALLRQRAHETLALLLCDVGPVVVAIGAREAHGIQRLEPQRLVGDRAAHLPTKTGCAMQPSSTWWHVKRLASPNFCQMKVDGEMFQGIVSL